MSDYIPVHVLRKNIATFLEVLPEKSEVRAVFDFADAVLKTRFAEERTVDLNGHAMIRAISTNDYTKGVDDGETLLVRTIAEALALNETIFSMEGPAVRWAIALRINIAKEYMGYSVEGNYNNQKYLPYVEAVLAFAYALTMWIKMWGVSAFIYNLPNPMGEEWEGVFKIITDRRSEYYEAQNASNLTAVDDPENAIMKHEEYTKIPDAPGWGDSSFVVDMTGRTDLKTVVFMHIASIYLNSAGYALTRFIEKFKRGTVYDLAKFPEVIGIAKDLTMLNSRLLVLATRPSSANDAAAADRIKVERLAIDLLWFDKTYSDLRARQPEAFQYHKHVSLPPEFVVVEKALAKVRIPAR